MEHLENIYQFVTKALFNIKDTGITLLSLFVVLLIVISSAWLVKFISRFLERRVFPRFELDGSMKNSLSLVAQIGIIAIALVLVLEITGIGLGIFLVISSRVIAPVGHTEAQAPQVRQTSVCL